MKHQQLLFTNDIDSALTKVVDVARYNKIFLLVDTNVNHCVLPAIESNPILANAVRIEIKSGDINKNLATLSTVWQQLGDKGATRDSLLINLGGGVVTDLGGYAASTFKRGIDFINIPTTLLGAVDAAVGGKTGINFNGLKNEIGVFREANAVIISTRFLRSLPIEEIKSGYAEMLKHGLLSNKESFYQLLNFDFQNVDFDTLLDLLQQSVMVKENIVKEDPHEQGLRRALNLGHTAGHAFESMALKRMHPIPHGYAVAWGLIIEIVLSHIKFKFDSVLLQQIADYIYTNYGAFHITCDDYDTLIATMRHDKKSHHGELNFTLLGDIGDVRVDCDVSADDVSAALDIYRDLVHI